MKETPFTPGPWEINRYENHIGYSIWAKDAGCIAERWYPSEKENAPIAENARLIAAAPEMYEALFKLRGAVDGILLEYEYLTECKALAIDALTKAVAQ
jgi:hypothetical protein